MSEEPTTKQITGLGTWSGESPIVENDRQKGLNRREFLKGVMAGAVVASPGANQLKDFVRKMDIHRQLAQEQISLPENIDNYLKNYLGGSYEQVSWDQLLDEITQKGVICLGEGHAVPEDMDFIWRTIQDIRERTERPVVVALERFEVDRDGDLIRKVNSAQVGSKDQSVALDELFTNSKYSVTWGENAKGGVYPSKDNFEELVTNVVSIGIPIVGIEVEHPEVGSVPEDERNIGWMNNLENAINSDELKNLDKPLVIVVGGSRHMSLREDMFVGYAEQNEVFQELGGVVSIQPPLTVESFFLSPEQRELMDITSEFVVRRGGPPIIPDSTPATEIPRLKAIKDYWVVMNPETMEAQKNK